jgi:hypothetical protein
VFDNKRNIIIVFLFIFAWIFIGSCKKESETNTAPEISNLVITPHSIVEWVDSVEIRFDYKDLEGDIGEEDPNIRTLEIKDSRLEESDFYHIQPLTPNDKVYSSQGTLTVKLNSMYRLGNAAFEKFTFTVSLRDRAGNQSNEIRSDTLQVAIF